MACSHSSEDSDSNPITGTMEPTDPNPDPESPNAAHQSSDESGSVLAELPSTNDQTPKLGESAAMVEVGETSRRRRSREQNLERVQTQLDASSAECRKYMEEGEVFGREVVALCTKLQNLMNKQFFNSEENRQLEDDALTSPAPLHSMVKDCSIFVVHLRGVLDERLNTDRAMLDTKDQEIEVLNA